jgi:hypothetical protein
MPKRILGWFNKTAPRYVIHVGPTKTGSKYMQHILFHSRETLRRNGIAYPDDWFIKPDQVMHETLWRLLQQGRYEEIEKSFRSINSQGHRVVVLSCEAFGDLEEAKLEALRDAIGNHRCEIVYYCRRWSDRIPSDWKQEVKMGRFTTLPEYYAPLLKNPYHLATINYSRVWQTLCRVFGRSSLRLVSFDHLRDRKIDQFKHFARHFLDWDGEHGVDAGLIDANVSPNSYDIEILRALNGIDYQAVRRYRYDMRVKFLYVRPNWDTRALESIMAEDLGTIDISDECESFLRSWNAIRRYADCFVDEESRSEPFPRRTAEFSYVRSNYLLNGGAVDELQALYRKLEDFQLEHPGLR